MEREERYYVIKKSDLEAALKVKRITQTDVEDLKELLARLNTQRFVSNKEMLKCVVVESDWPEYETVWQMIEDRVDGFDGGREPLKGLTQLSSLARMGIAHHAFGNPIPQPIYDVIRRTEMAMVEFNQDVIRKARLFDELQYCEGCGGVKGNHHRECQHPNSFKG